jgi:hypothetical protein
MRVRAVGAGAQSEGVVSAPRTIPDDDVPRYCRRADEVQGMVDDVVQGLEGRREQLSPQQYGTLAHQRLEEAVKQANDAHTERGRLTAEQKFSSDTERTPTGRLRSIRTDIVENVDDSTVCVYDLKTGEEGLTPVRAREILEYVRRGYPYATRIIVMETRARR